MGGNELPMCFNIFKSHYIVEIFQEETKVSVKLSCKIDQRRIGILLCYVSIKIFLK